MNKVLTRIVMPNFHEKEMQPPERGRRFLSEFVKKAQEGFDTVMQVVNTGVQGVGPSIASADKIAVSNAIHHITGTATVNTITPSPGHSGPVFLVSDDGFSVGTGGNIGMAKTYSAGQMAHLAFDDVKQMWYPA